MNKLDRLSMLKKLSFIGEDNINIFSSYIPDHYDEIYTLYTIFDKTSIDYSNIEFKEPLERNSSFIFKCTLSDKYYDKLNEYFNANNIIKYMRSKSFNVSIKKEDNVIEIKFKTI